MVVELGLAVLGVEAVPRGLAGEQEAPPRCHWLVSPGPGEAVPAAVSVPPHIHHDPEPAAGGCPQGGGHDEEELL